MKTLKPGGENCSKSEERNTEKWNPFERYDSLRDFVLHPGEIVIREIVRSEEDAQI